jgi:diaminopimelate decarboxylase
VDQVFFSSVANLGPSYLGVYNSLHFQIWKVQAVWKSTVDVVRSVVDVVRSIVDVVRSSMDVVSCGGGGPVQPEEEASPPLYSVSAEIVALYSHHAHTLLCAGQ